MSGSARRGDSTDSSSDRAEDLSGWLVWVGFIRIGLRGTYKEWVEYLAGRYLPRLGWVGLIRMELGRIYQDWAVKD